jgi:hypothetical protein
MAVRLLVLLCIKYIQPQTSRVEHQPILGARLLQLLRNETGILNLLQLNVGLALLDSVANEIGGSRLTLCLDNHGLLLLSGLVDDKGSPLRLLLSDLLGLDGGREFGREGKVLVPVG